MFRMKALASIVALSTLISACSGNDTESNEPAETAKASEAVPAGPPPATDVTTLDGSTFVSLSGNADTGKAVFAQCRACHVTDAGVNKIGPSLNGIIGRKAGTVSGFSYSPANAGSDFVWSKEKLFDFLEKPQHVIPKTKMIFAGLPDPQKRADLIAYLESPE
jgi:cytochrome c